MKLLRNIIFIVVLPVAVLAIAYACQKDYEDDINCTWRCGTAWYIKCTAETAWCADKRIVNKQPGEPYP